MEGHTYSFEKLDVWQKARTYVSTIYKLTESFPDVEKFGLISQLRRASISIVSNIAEGTSRSSLKDQIRFTEIAYGSAIETYCQLIVSVDLGFIDSTTFESTKIQLNEITIKLSGLKNSQIKRLNEQSTKP
ncbi:MAG: four helix bundle protein [Paludibacter sp.]